MSLVPFFGQAVIGFRQWLLIDGALCPLFTCTLSAAWQPGVNVAECMNTARRTAPTRHGAILNIAEPAYVVHEAGPVNDCTCGFYARHDVTDTMHRDHIKGRVTGAIAAWGDIEVHHDGFRAQFVTILGLYGSDTTPLPDGMAERYGVPVFTDLHALEADALKHGAPLPASVIPPDPQIDKDRIRAMQRAGRPPASMSPAQNEEPAA